MIFDTKIKIFSLGFKVQFKFDRIKCFESPLAFKLTGRAVFVTGGGGAYGGYRKNGGQGCRWSWWRRRPVKNFILVFFCGLKIYFVRHL